jgi:hypothetical protein
MTATELKMNPATEPRTGHIYLCLKSNRKQSTVKGKYYLYDSGELKTYTSRNVTLLTDYLKRKAQEE